MAEQSASYEDVLKTVSLDVRICVGTARPKISEVMTLQPEAILALDRTISDPVELWVGDRVIGLGYLEEVEEEGVSRLAVRISRVGAGDDGEDT